MNPSLIRQLLSQDTNQPLDPRCFPRQFPTTDMDRLRQDFQRQQQLQDEFDLSLFRASGMNLGGGYRATPSDIFTPPSAASYDPLAQFYPGVATDPLERVRRPYGAVFQETQQQQQPQLPQQAPAVPPRSSTDASQESREVIILRELLADKEREEHKVRMISELIEHRRKNNAAVHLINQIVQGNAPSQAEILKTLQENTAVEYGILDLIEASLTQKKRVHKVVRSLIFRLPLAATTGKEAEEESEFDKRFDSLTQMMFLPDVGARLFGAGALGDVHGAGAGGVGGQPRAPSPAASGGKGGSSSGVHIK
ncbi:hypothetical protein HDU98_008319 [Podochytrium sp. JEL0797]|nr:hypothetical protein HDU98_008319 [Podochytrium sp. JEL0797]